MPLPLAAHISVLRHAPLTCWLRHACLCACAGLGFDSDEEPGAEAEQRDLAALLDDAALADLEQLRLCGQGNAGAVASSKKTKTKCIKT